MDTKPSLTYQLAILIREHPMFSLKNVRDHLGSNWTSNRLGSQIANLRENHGWEIEYNRVLNIWHVIEEGNMPRKKAIVVQLVELLQYKPNGMSVPLICKKLSCTPENLLWARAYLNRDKRFKHKLRKSKDKYFLEKKNDSI